MSHDPTPPNDVPPGARPEIGGLLRDVEGAVRQSSGRDPYPLLAATALALTLVWLLWPEGGAIGAATLKLWTLFVLACVALLFMPLWAGRLQLAPGQAWRLCAGGAGGLGFAWVAFLLPAIASNQAFFGTLGTAAAALAAWTAPGRPE